MDLNMFGNLLTEAEEHFLKQARDNLRLSGLTKSELSKATHELNQITIEMYSIKHAERNAKNLIDSNKKLAQSNERHARAMRWFTGVLAFVAVAQLIVVILTRLNYL